MEQVFSRKQLADCSVIFERSRFFRFRCLDLVVDVYNLAIISITVGRIKYLSCTAATWLVGGWTFYSLLSLPCYVRHLSRCGVSSVHGMEWWTLNADYGSTECPCIQSN